MRKMLFSLMTIMILLFVVACGETNDETESIDEAKQTVTPVKVEKISRGNLTAEQTVFGHVMPKTQTPVIPGQAGEITDLKVEPGDEVNKNEQLASMKTSMGTMSIKAPVAGKVGQLTLDKNDFYNGEDPFAIIYDDETVLVQFSVTPEMKKKFKIDKSYKTTIEDKEYDAEVKRIESLPNENGQYDITAHIDNEKGKILLGAVAEIAVSEILEKDTLLVSTEAIITDNEETYIYVVEDDQAKKVLVDVLESQTDQSAIKADLKKKAEVIISGQFLLTDGSKVDVEKDGN